MNVYQAINNVQADLARVGIEKSRKNVQQGYMFRGIDDVYGALSPLLAKHGLCILPRVVSRDVTERQTAKGGLLFYTVLTVEFDFVAVEDGSKHTIVTVGEAMDSGDKPSNKAMSAAYKYAALQAFAVPTEGDNDADAHTHEIAPARHPAGKPIAAVKAELPDAQFPAALQAVRDGKRTAEYLRGKYALTTEQDNALHALSLEAAQ